MAGDCHRLMVATTDPAALLRGAEPEFLCARPDSSGSPRATAEQYPVPTETATPLDQLTNGAAATLLLGYFPNLIEYTEI